MKLFGRDKEKNADELLPEEQLSEELAEAAAPIADGTTPFVMNIEGLDPIREEKEETVAGLRGATRTLPGKEQIEEAIEAAEEAPAPAEDAAPAPNPDSTPEENPAPALESILKAEPAAGEKPVPEPEPASTPEPATAPRAEKEEAPKEEKLSSVSYASVAQAMVNAKKEPTGRFDRDAMDDDTLLAELYALIGDRNTKKPAAEKETPAPVQTKPTPRPAARITPETLQAAPEEFIEVEEDTSGVPGWLKGVFILLISLLLSAMTFYAVASDVIGKIF